MYIDKADRLAFDEGLGLLPTPRNTAELGYLVTKLCRWYESDHEESFQMYVDILGALDGARQDVLGNYLGFQKEQRLENGDI